MAAEAVVIPRHTRPHVTTRIVPQAGTASLDAEATRCPAHDERYRTYDNTFAIGPYGESGSRS